MGQSELVKEYFDSLSSDYQNAYELDKNDPIRTYIFNERKKIVLDLIGQQKGRLIDIGCGPGVMTKELLKKDFSVYNIDISPLMIERAKQGLSAHKYKNRVFFEVSNIEDMNFKDSYFDVVLCIGVIEYLGDRHSAMVKISKILKKGGTIIISFPNKSSVLNILDSVLRNTIFRIAPKKFDVHKSIKRQGIEIKSFAPFKFAHDLEQYGFSKIDIKFHGYRLAIFKRVFPKFWIFVSKILGGLNLLFLAPILANDCVIKLKKV